MSEIIEKHQTLDEYIDQLIESGHEELGAGCYAEVYSIPGDDSKVIKVGQCDFSFADDPYLEYIKRIDPTNPFCPVVHSVELVKFLDCHRYIVHLERLTEYSKVPNGPEVNQQWFKDHRVSSLDRKNVELNVADDRIVDVMDTIHAICHEALHFTCTDIRQNNVMYRNTNQGWIPVFTDPVC